MAGLRVDWRASLSLVGTVLRYLAVPLAVPLLLGVIDGTDWAPFAITVVVTVTLGWALERLDPDRDLGSREGFLMVAATWLLVSIVGGLPYVLAGIGSQSTLANPVNALFESMSGFTTTGATVMGEISTARHSRPVLLWRQLTQWLGGMGIVVLAVAILPELSVGGAQLMDAEAPGPGIEKLTPRIAETARALWVAYVGITALEMVLLYGLHLGGLAPNMTLFNAVSHGLTTMATGGFSPEARSIAAFSAAVQWVIIPFMIAAGTNFALFWHVLTGEPDHLFRDEEFRFYLGLLGVFTAVVAAILFTDSGFQAAVGVTGPVMDAIEPTVRHAAFQVVSIVTTTGYASMDFNVWGPVGHGLLLAFMFVGGSAGSTGGSIKVVRWLLILKGIRRELFTTVHPEAVTPVRLGGRAIDEKALRGVYGFTLLYVLSFAVATPVVLWLGFRGEALSVLEAASAVAATLGNVGPGFGAVGPMNSYVGFPPLSKLLMVGLMWIGRLEILPVLVVFTRAYWRT
ncbi:MAG: TrkH family potassium uptake protein [Halodesulfurarchaeum sp.]